MTSLRAPRTSHPNTKRPGFLPAAATECLTLNADCSEVDIELFLEELGIALDQHRAPDQFLQLLDAFPVVRLQFLGDLGIYAQDNGGLGVLGPNLLHLDEDLI